ncbi:hypothetical protein RRV45_07430 [Bacillus sp. DTU_2020_1000418_1_SI_GHA_SEK_038]|uniref:hypothetical protein n=1 Tax=Bacillus sp. DTU_2020_1000418_1_SI_GHA_SEK_038 TaxID=3077585 RepID=UPI0028EC6F80|nr:hypothetical protein [Bacillus sp. DTU_2020_1000418_1_SI_GHA_SEK_038]WNS76809.1 hypothetical protein RRV45_07430 [Bacillus sp. DTU_2020_1000418_1_SI_GHA_SEK_038]
MEQKQIASFIVRFHLAEIDEQTGKKKWRIKVSHVQEDIEILFETIEDAMNFMRNIIGD